MIGYLSEIFGTANFVIVVMAKLACLQIVIATIEHISIRDVYRETGVLSWNVIRQARVVYYQKWAENIFNRLLGYKGVIAIHYLRLLFAGLVLVSPMENESLFLVYMFPLVFVTLLFNFRTFFGDDGSDQMAFIVLISSFSFLLIMHLTDAQWVQVIPILFVAFQIVSSYFVSGIAKTFSHEWRSGVALKKILNHHSYGNAFITSRLQNSDKVLYSVNYFVIFFQLLFPLVLLSNDYIAGALIITGIGFHVGIAVVMGINGFLPSFLSAYPALIYTREIIHSSI